MVGTTSTSSDIWFSRWGRRGSRPYRINVEIVVTISKVEKNQPFKEIKEVKNKVEIRLNGIIGITGEKHNYHKNLYLSPLSIE